MTDHLAAHLRRHVERLASVPRPPGSAAHTAAQEYLAQELGAAGFTVRPWEGRQGGFAWINLLTDPVPAYPAMRLLIVAAHYDSIPHSPGADDNASALAALIELARWVRPKLDTATCKARLQLAAYDLEEYGLIGSYTHAREVKSAGTPVYGMISLEMLGYVDARPGGQRLPPQLAGIYPDTGDFIGVIGNEASAGLMLAVAQAMRTVPGLPVQHLAVPDDGRLLPDTRRSDHSSFWDQGVPALMVTDTSFFRNPHYHQATDTPETLNYDFLARVTQGVCAATWAIIAAPGQKSTSEGE
jgi:Zn-dependent M28 family amino/carboxypeptidase